MVCPLKAKSVSQAVPPDAMDLSMGTTSTPSKTARGLCCDKYRGTEQQYKDRTALLFSNTIQHTTIHSVSSRASRCHSKMLYLHTILELMPRTISMRLTCRRQIAVCLVARQSCLLALLHATNYIERNFIESDGLRAVGNFPLRANSCLTLATIPAAL